MPFPELESAHMWLLVIPVPYIFLHASLEMTSTLAFCSVFGDGRETKTEKQRDFISVISGESPQTVKRMRAVHKLTSELHVCRQEQLSNAQSYR